MQNHGKARAILLTAVTCICAVVAVEYYVRSVFVPDHLAKLYEKRGHPVQDFTDGRYPAIAMNLARVHTSGRMKIVLIGDGSMRVRKIASIDQLGFRVRRNIQQQLGTMVDLIDLSILGLDVNEAAYLTAYATELEPAIIVYGLTPCALIATEHPRPNRIQAVTSTPRIIGKLGYGFVLATSDTAKAISGILRSALWTTVLLPQLRSRWNVGITAEAGPHVGSVPTDNSEIRTESSCMVQAINDVGIGPRARLSLAALARVCEDYNGRCLGYLAPINPAVLLTPHAETISRLEDSVREIVTPFGLRMASLADVLDVQHFQSLPNRQPDPIHLNAEGRSEFAHILGRLIVETSRQLSKEYDWRHWIATN